MTCRPRTTGRNIQRTMTSLQNSICWHTLSAISLPVISQEDLHFVEQRVRLQNYYRPPIQDGPSASSHSTEVPSVAKSVSEWDTRMQLAVQGEMAGFGVGVGWVVVKVKFLSGPINGDLTDCMEVVL